MDMEETNREAAELPGNAEMYHLDHVSELEKVKLKGKRILWLGSSVTWGHWSLQVSMADYIAKRQGCVCVKEAVSGTTLMNKDDESYVARLYKIDSGQKFDAAVVQLSTNDARQKIPLGRLPEEGVTEYDEKTVFGAMETIFDYIRKTWNCPTFIYTGTRFVDEEYQQMVDALPVFAKKWGIHVIDLWNNEEMNKVSKEDFNLYMHDPVHPTQAGYLVWWTPFIEKKLCEVTNY